MNAERFANNVMAHVEDEAAGLTNEQYIVCLCTLAEKIETEIEDARKAEYSIPYPFEDETDY